MGSAFEWLSATIEWFGRFVPRWVILDTTMGGVKFVRGTRVVPLAPGIHFYWPATTRFDNYPTADQTDELRSQTIVTTDDRVVDVAGLVRYEVADVARLLSFHFDAKAAIADRSLTAIHRACCRLSWAELKEGQRKGTLETKLRNAVRDELADLGVRVTEVSLTDMAPTRVIKLKSSTRQDGEV